MGQSPEFAQISPQDLHYGALPPPLTYVKLTLGRVASWNQGKNNYQVIFRGKMYMPWFDNIYGGRTQIMMFMSPLSKIHPFCELGCCHKLNCIAFIFPLFHTFLPIIMEWINNHWTECLSNDHRLVIEWSQNINRMIIACRMIVVELWVAGFKIDKSKYHHRIIFASHRIIVERVRIEWWSDDHRISDKWSLNDHRMIITWSSNDHRNIIEWSLYDDWTTNLWSSNGHLIVVFTGARRKF